MYLLHNLVTCICYITLLHVFVTCYCYRVGGTARSRAKIYIKFNGIYCYSKILGSAVLRGAGL